MFVKTDHGTRRVWSSQNHQHLTGLMNADFFLCWFSFNVYGCYYYMWSIFFLYFLQFPCATQLKREKHTEHFDKVNHDVHWRWCLVFWSLSPRPDGGLQHIQSHFVLAREGPAAHLASRHAPWKKGILYGEDRGIVPHWCMRLLVSVPAATLWYSRWNTRY